MIKLGIIGCGYWGANLVRNFYQADNCEIKIVAEESSARQDFVKSNYPEIKVTSDYKELLKDGVIDAIIVATPASHHYELAEESLRAGKHVFVEKPLALTSRDAEELVALADKAKKILMVGHTVIYNEAIKKLKEFVDSGEIGEIYYAYASRLNLGKVRSDVNVMWNLAPHDVSVLLYLLNKNLN